MRARVRCRCGAGLGVHDHQLASGLDVQPEETVGIDHHEVRLEADGAVGARGSDDVRTEGEVRDEDTVHHVPLDPVDARGAQRSDLLSQAREVGWEDGRDDAGSHGTSAPEAPRVRITHAGGPRGEPGSVDAREAQELGLVAGPHARGRGSGVDDHQGVVQLARGDLDRAARRTVPVCHQPVVQQPVDRGGGGEGRPVASGEPDNLSECGAVLVEGGIALDARGVVEEERQGRREHPPVVGANDPSLPR